MTSDLALRWEVLLGFSRRAIFWKKLLTELYDVLFVSIARIKLECLGNVLKVSLFTNIVIKCHNTINSWNFTFLKILLFNLISMIWLYSKKKNIMKFFSKDGIFQIIFYVTLQCTEKKCICLVVTLKNILYLIQLNSVLLLSKSKILCWL